MRYNFNIGDRLAINKGPNITHYGIYSGNGMVIDNSSTKGKVVERPIEEFSGGRPIRVVPITSRYPPHEVLKRARERVGMPYGWFSQNCEHFVNVVQLNRAESQQVQNLVVSLFAIWAVKRMVS